jgi:hypothetical protein
MSRRNVFLAWLLALGARAQQVPSFQTLTNNPPRCPLCKTSVTLTAVSLVILGPTGVDGSTLAFPTLLMRMDDERLAIRQKA